MILIINLNENKLHSLEFIKPITDLIKNHKVIHYKKITQQHLKQANKIILAGTSLKDINYLKDYKKFQWIKTINKPILGICAGMQIIGKVYKSKLVKQTEIGVIYPKTTNKHKLFKITKAYSLHNLSITLPKDFKTYLKTKHPQAIKHNTKEIYGVLFHPEVLNKELIINFTT